MFANIIPCIVHYRLEWKQDMSNYQTLYHKRRYLINLRGISYGNLFRFPTKCIGLSLLIITMVGDDDFGNDNKD